MDRVPDVACVKSSNILTTVVFPAPLGPSRAKYSPLATEKEVWSTAVRDPYRFVTAFNSIMAHRLIIQLIILYYRLHSKYSTSEINGDSRTARNKDRPVRVARRPCLRGHHS
jgi:hypothetical protein